MSAYFRIWLWNMDLVVLTAFIVYIVVVVSFGIIACKITKNLSDYVLGGRSLAGPIAALSAGASDMSAWLLLGLPGAVYVAGLSQIWVPLGLLLGAYINWKVVAKPLRIYTEYANDSLTVPAFLDNRFSGSAKKIRIISAIAQVVFFAVYIASGFLAGAKLVAITFKLDYQQALLISSLIIVSYTFIGGFLAVSWTDFFQGMLMMGCMLFVPYFLVEQLGSWHNVTTLLLSDNVNFLSAHTGISAVGLLSLLAWGVGYFGQPHILVRFMSVKTAQEIPTARAFGMGWMFLSLLGAVLIGLTGKAFYLSDLSVSGLAEPEMIFVEFANLLFNPVISGLLLAAIISAIMCAADSQILASSSALTEDVYRAILRPHATQKELVWVGRIFVILIACVAFVLASNPNSLVMDLVQFAWAGLGATFGPAVLFSLFWRRATENGVYFAMLIGASTVIVWKLLSYVWLELSALNEIVPGFILSGLTLLVVSRRDKVAQEVLTKYDKAWQLIKQS